jgi:hypothetical protein
VIDPIGNMMDIAPAGWYRTPWESASAVSQDYCAANRGGHGVAGAADVQWLTRAPSTTGITRASTGDPPGDFCVDGATQGQ